MNNEPFKFVDRNFAALCCSKRASGKTFLCNYLLKHFSDNNRFDYYILFSQTSHVSGDFACIPQKCHFKEFTEKTLNKVFEFQTKQKKSNNPKNCLIIIDDCIGGIGHDFLILLNKLYSLGRHYNISIILLTQYLKNSLSPVIRNNVDYMFFSINNRNTVDVIYDMVVYPHDRKTFYKFVHENTTDYRFIIYDNTKSSSNNFSIIKASDPGEFSVDKKNNLI